MTTGIKFNNGSNIIDAANKLEASRIPVDSSKLLYITSDDGKGYIWRGVTGDPVFTHSDDGGDYCGTKFIPEFGDGSEAWIRDYDGYANVEWFGAVGDGVTNSAAFIQQAINNNLDVKIPEGNFILEDEITITSSHIGLSLRGVGNKTILTLQGGVATNYRAILITDATTQVRDITISDMLLHGNKDLRTSTVSRGIWAPGSAGTRAKNITLQNIWATSFDLSGIDLDLESANIDTLYLWNNDFHGLAVSSSDITEEAVQINGVNIHAWFNGGLGIDISSNTGEESVTCNLSNVVVHNNIQGGIKIACNGTLNLSNIVCKDNLAKGIRVANACRSINIDNLVCVENDDTSLDISAPSVPNWGVATAYTVGNIVFNDSGKLYICTTAGTTAGSGGPTGINKAISDNTVIWDYFPMLVHVNNYTVRKSFGSGLLVAVGEFNGNNLSILDSDGQNVFVDTSCQKFRLNNFNIARSVTTTGIDLKSPDQILSNGSLYHNNAAGSIIRAFSPLTMFSVTLNSIGGGLNSNNMSSGDRLTLHNVDFGDVSGTQITSHVIPNVLAIDCNLLTLTKNPYTPTNVSVDRSYDANLTTLDELADVLGTLISDLQFRKLIS